MYNNYIRFSSIDKFYDANEGFYKGTLDKTIYGQYKNYIPKEIVNLNDQQSKLLFLQKCDFAINDLMLYLDIYDNDEYAFKLLNYYKEQYQKALSEYQKDYGLIRPTCISSTYNWNKSFPWEVK